AFAVTAADRATQLAGPGFDAAVWELWPYLTAGASVHLSDEANRITPESLRDWLVTQRITICFLPTVLTQGIMALEWPPETALRVLLTGGDTLHHNPPPALPFMVVNNYGPTESTVVATSGPVMTDEHPDRLPPIGHPIANTQIYILDSHLKPVSIGVPGELHISGVGLARGYLNRPELTADKFIPNPFSREPGARLYKTGDLARYLPDGNIEFLGRLDHQVKIRGFRIELGEIEAVLSEHPAVRESVVVAMEDMPGDLSASLGAGKCLVAYVVSKQEQEPTMSELRNFLKEKLPDYMVPSAFVFLDALPLTLNGKIDRRALPAPDRVRPELEGTFVAPQTPNEELLAEIWSEILGVERVGIHDNFFELGGHSLLATQVISRVRKTFQVEVPLRTLFEMPTIEEFAEVIIQSQAKGAEQEDLSRMLAELESISDEEARQRLAYESK
ncbi:MAG: non-ribosomal peptide synthetase, partial [Deltaproteobacteria bacterium]|nr:non-ribosomal peptide synthetase [Deltaproteobacteria bacterium]